jgi:putative spermidine/putrescine transport system substrate-binding protein
MRCAKKNTLRVSLLVTVLSVNLAAQAESQPTLTIATWGGAYEAAQQAVLFQPFTAATGIVIQTQAYSGGLTILDADPPDVVDMSMAEVLAGCQSGDLISLDYSDLPAGIDGTPAQDDFIAGALHPCGLAHSVYATVIAYDSRAFPGQRPSKVEDLFDLETFPGPRALQILPYASLEWALMSHGVPRRELYALLSTPRGLALAFDRLATLAGQLLWWQEGETPVQLLESGAAVMASGYNGRFFNARLSRASPIEIIWDGQLQERQAWVIPDNASQKETAWAFIRFATTSERMSAIAERMAYGPTRLSAAERVGRHPVVGIDMWPHIPSHPYNAATAIRKDVYWYARTYQRIKEQFDRWRLSVE